MENVKMKCKRTGETFIIGKEYVGGFAWGDDRNYTYRAMSLRGYLSEAKHTTLEGLIEEVNAIELVELEITD